MKGQSEEQALEELNWRIIRNLILASAFGAACLGFALFFLLLPVIRT